MSHKILLVEDDETLQETIKYNLSRQGYEVEAVADGRSALAMAREMEPNLIVLDVMLPEMDGFEVCRILRKEMSVPIMMLTARTDEVDRVVGLEMGADDYLTKPFSMRELMARVKAMLRRVQLIRAELEAAPDPAETNVADSEILSFGNMIINLRRHEISIDGQPIQMKPMERELLLFLARNRGIALSRDLILERVWGWQYDSGSRTVDVHVRWLREKIEADPKNPVRIITVRGLGYRFEG